jgi:hypothetical protein
MSGTRQPIMRVVLRQVTWRRILLVQPIALVWLVFRIVNTHFFPPARLPPTFVISGIIIDELTVIGLLLAILWAREAAHRGRSTLAAYAAPLVIVSLLVGFTQYYVRQWAGVQLIVDVDDPTAIRRKWFNMTYIALDTLIYGAFIMVTFVGREREKECVEQMRQVTLQRAELESELARSRLTELQARLDPQRVLAELAHIRTLYETESANAEESLDALAQDLRAKLDSARPAAQSA